MRVALHPLTKSSKYAATTVMSGFAENDRVEDEYGEQVRHRQRNSGQESSLTACTLIRWLLSLERQLLAPNSRSHRSHEHEHIRTFESNFCTCHLYQRVRTFFVGAIASYHLMILVVYLPISRSRAEGPYAPALFFSLFLDFIAILTLASITAQCSPLTVSLGLDVEPRSRVWTMLDTFKTYALRSALVHDPTTRWMAVGHVGAFLVNVISEVIVFASATTSYDTRPEDSGQSSQSVPVEASTNSYVLIVGGFVYLFGALSCTVVLTLCSGHVSLSHNLLAVQLEQLACCLRDKTNQKFCQLDRFQTIDLYNTQQSNNLKSTKTVPSSQGQGMDKVPEGLGTKFSLREAPGRLGVSRTRTAPSCEALAEEFGPDGITSDALLNIHLEFQRRVQVLKNRGFYWRIGLVVVLLATETIVMVSQGYVDQHETETRMQTIGVIGTYCSNSYSMGSMVYSLGRVLYASRERVASEANHWAVAQRVQIQRDKLQAAAPLVSSSTFNREIKTNSERWRDEAKSILAREAAHFLYEFPIRFHVGFFELSEDVVKASILLLLGLAALFVGINIPVV